MEGALIAVCVLSGLVGSSLGFGGAMVLAPACFWLLPPAEAVMSVALLSNLTNLLILTERRAKQFDRGELTRLLSATLPGLLLGIALLQTINASWAIALAGATILLGVGLRVLGRRLQLHMPAWPVYPVGAACGVLAGTVGLATLAPAWLLLRRLPPARLRDSLQLYYLIVGLLVMALGALWLGTDALLPAWWVLAGGSIGIGVGHALGQRLFERLARRHALYERLALLALGAIGLISATRGLAGLF